MPSGSKLFTVIDGGSAFLHCAGSPIRIGINAGGNVDSLFDTLKNLGPARLGVILMTVFGLLVFFIFIAVRSGTPNMTMLYGDLSATDSSAVAARLDGARIPYRFNDNGNQVLVSSKDVGRARMLLAEEGLPRGATMGYEIFDKKQSFGTTSFVQNINQLRALEGELARTIGTIDAVRSARVHLVLPQREIFSRETRPASASVFLSLRNSAALGKEQVQAIQHLVAASVPQLKASAVAIIDANGNLLARADDGQQTPAGQAGQDLRMQYERQMTRSVEDMVSKVVGFGKVRVNVAADLNFDTVSRNSEIYDPEGQVVRSTQTTTEEDIDNTGANRNAVSVQTNLPGLPGNVGADGGVAGMKSSRSEEVTNYEITRTVESLVRESGEVRRLSVAVLVDGRYEADPNAQPPEGSAGRNWTPPRVYVPRTQEELDQIATLVRSAIGYDDSRGDTVEVVNMQFADVDFFGDALDDGMLFGFPREDILGMAETLTLSLVAILVILLVLRPLASHIVANSAARENQTGSTQDEMAMLTAQGAGAGPGVQGQLAPPTGALARGGDGVADELEAMIDMSQVEGKVKASSVQKISELVSNHPNETISVIRGWISQENS